MPDIYINDPSYHNSVPAALVAATVVVLDTSNTTQSSLAVALPAAALAQPFGIVMENAKLDASGSPVAGSGVTTRHWGAAQVQVASAVAVGDKLSVANTSGQVQTQARTAGASQPVPIVGIARSAASTAGQTVDVLLAIGSTW